MVNEISGTEIKCTVIYGGLLGNHKGINLPGVKVSAPSLTEKDKEDAKLALELGVDFLALSFVRSASDIYDLKKLRFASSTLDWYSCQSLSKNWLNIIVQYLL